MHYGAKNFPKVRCVLECVYTSLFQSDVSFAQEIRLFCTREDLSCAKETFPQSQICTGVRVYITPNVYTHSSTDLTLGAHMSDDIPDSLEIWSDPKVRSVLECVYTSTSLQISKESGVGWLRLVGSLKLYVSFAEYRLFYRALLQKRPIIWRSLLIVATPYVL